MPPFKFSRRRGAHRETKIKGLVGTKKSRAPSPRSDKGREFQAGQNVEQRPL